MPRKPRKTRISPEGIKEVQCSKCKEYWPATLEFYYRYKRNSYGLSGMCKACYLDTYSDKRTGEYYQNYWRKRKDVLIGS